LILFRGGTRCGSSSISSSISLEGVPPLDVLVDGALLGHSQILIQILAEIAHLNFVVFVKLIDENGVAVPR